MTDPLRLVLIAVAGWMNQRQLRGIDYLREDTVCWARLGEWANSAADKDGVLCLTFCQLLRQNDLSIIIMQPDATVKALFVCLSLPALLGAKSATIKDTEEQVLDLELSFSDPATPAAVSKAITPFLADKLTKLTDLLTEAIDATSDLPPSQGKALKSAYTADLKRALDERIDLAIAAKDTERIKTLLAQQRKLPEPESNAPPDIECLRKKIAGEEGIDADARLGSASDKEAENLNRHLRQYRSLLCQERSGLLLLMNVSTQLTADDRKAIDSRTKDISNELPRQFCNAENTKKKLK